MHYWSHIPRMYLNLGHKLGHYVKLKKYLVGTLEVIFLAQWTRKLVIMLVLTKSRVSLNFGHLCHELGLYVKLRNTCTLLALLRPHFLLYWFQIGHNIFLHEISHAYEFGSPEVINKVNRSNWRNTLKKPHLMLIEWKTGQNTCLDEISHVLKFGSPLVIN